MTDRGLFTENPLAWYLALFPSCTRGKPRFTALAEAVLRQAADLIALARSVAPGFSFTRAEGAQLDALGLSAGIPRKEGWDDGIYRGVLLRKLKLYTWDGTNETAAEYLEEGETLRDNGDNSVTAGTPASLPLPAREMLPVPVGVKIDNG